MKILMTAISRATSAITSSPRKISRLKRMDRIAITNMAKPNIPSRAHTKFLFSFFLTLITTERKNQKTTVRLRPP